MFNFLKTIAVILVGLTITTHSQAQGVSGATGRTATTMPEAGVFETLSSENRKIAEAIFNGQTVTADGSAPLSLDQIAAARQPNGWDHLFGLMKANGLTDAKNLGQLVSNRYENRTVNGHAMDHGTPGTTIVTMASGGQIIIDKKSNYASDPGRAGYKHSYQSSNGRMVYRGRLHSASILGY